MVDVIERPKHETLTRPPGKWFNFFLVTSECYDADGVECLLGDKMMDHRPWSSREIAEQKAADLMNDKSDVVWRTAIYLGAYPEGETP